MKAKFFFASLILMGASLVSHAQGYKDGIEYYKVDQLDNAKELLERNLNSASTDKAEAFYYLGQIALKNGDASKASQLFDQGVSANANQPLNYVGKAAVALKNGGDAKKLFEQARKLSKKDCALEMEIARAYYNANPTKYAKDIEKSLKNARKWNMSDPNSYIFEADTYADKRDWGKAAGLYELAFTNDPDNAEAYVKYANTYFNVNPTMAIDRLEELLQKTPNSALVQRQLAEKYYADNQGAKAAEQYGQYIKNPNHFAQDEVRYVQLLFFGGKYQESYDLATSLINKLNPSDSKVFFMKRMQLYNLVMLEKWNDAANAGKELFDMPLPTGASYESRDYTDYGQALQNVGKPEEAIACYEKAIELNPKNANLIRNMGDAYADNNDYVKAAAYYQRLVDSGIAEANDLLILSRYYTNVADNTSNAAERTDALNKALQYANEADQRVPNNVQIAFQKARIAVVKEGEDNKGGALNEYKHLLSLLEAKEDKSGYDSYYKRIYNYLANYEFQFGDKDKAKEYYKLWLQHDPNNDALRKYVEKM